MKKYPLIIAIAALVLAAVILIFASGARRIYSSSFFIALGVLQLVTAWRLRGQRGG